MLGLSSLKRAYFFLLENKQDYLVFLRWWGIYALHFSMQYLFVPAVAYGVHMYNGSDE